MLAKACCAWLLLLATFSGCGSEPAASDTPPAQKSEREGGPVRKSSKQVAPPAATEVAPRPGKTPVVPAESGPTEFSPQRKVYRPSDDRPKRDAAALAELGIKRFASKHLELYTDIPPETAKKLPAVVDQLYVALEKYFGPLPPDREGGTFQMTGYIMADPRVFRETGLLPEDLPAFNHGRHRGAEFWMNSQDYEYYLRHLMLHEVTHCFMTITRQEHLMPPVWYMEGMAELFGTHAIAPDGTATFRTMPDDKEAYAGLGRITLIQTAVKEGRFRWLDQVLELVPNDYSNDEAYAWSWAICKFLDTHPRYRDEFRKLGDAPTGRIFLDRLQEAYRQEANDLRTEWALFAHQLEYGYQIEPAAIAFEPGKPLSSARPETEVVVKADRGWQSAGVVVEQGKKYTLTAAGRFTLAQAPKPWTSEPQGISFRYFNHRPLGQLLGCVRTETPDAIASAGSMRQVFSIGANHTFIAPQTGTLYLRLNDAWSQLSDNTGSVSVRVRLE